MDKTAIKNFAIQARKELIAGVKQKAYEYGIEDRSTGNEATSGALLNGRILTPEEQKQRNELLQLIRTKGYAQVMEEVAYTWFNRFIALRFMEVNEYLPSRIRIFTNVQNEFRPEILSEALHLNLLGLDKLKVISLIEANQAEELYKYLLITQCNDLNNALPEMFEKIQNYTELLFPNNLLKEGSVLSCMISYITQDDWKDAVEIIGWLYQYYNTEVKDETFALLKKNVKITKERIPAATQLFTPDWIVRYMVENSLGRLWIEGHPSDELESTWKYYLDEAEQEPEVEEQLQKIRADYAKIKPDKIKVIDPCMGSGHILVYAFDVLMQIYIATGYSEQDAAKSILQNNLFGLDIDDRAYQLSYFAVMMKARKYCRTIFSAKIHTNLYSIQESNFATQELIDFVAEGDAGIKYDLQAITETLYDAKEYGSILNIPNIKFEIIINRLEEIQFKQINDLQQQAFQQTIIDRLTPLIHQAQVMAQKYDVVVTNPPYMGNGGMSTILSEFAKKNYPDSKSDLFAVFIERCREMTRHNGLQAMITQQAWMFLSGFEKLRKKLIYQNIINMTHLGSHAFEDIGGEVVQTTTFVLRNRNLCLYNGKYSRLVKYTSQKEKENAFLVKKDLYTTKQESFVKIPGMPIAYWVSERVLKTYEIGLSMERFAPPKQGSTLGDNDRFLRFWFEVHPNKSKWFPCVKGGEYRKWYGNHTYLINWENNGSEVKSTGRATIRNANRLFTDGISWSRIVSERSSFRRLYNNFFFESASGVCFPEFDYINYTMGLLNTKIVKDYAAIVNPTLTLQSGDVCTIPVIVQNKPIVESIVNDNICISKIDWDSYEISWDFLNHPLLRQNTNRLISDAYEEWNQFTINQFSILKANEEELNRIFIDMYGLHDELAPDVEDKDITVRKADLVREIRSLLSYGIGVVFGRYSVDEEGLVYVGGDWDNSKYATIIPDKDNILPISDDVYFEDDIVSKVVDFVKVVYGEETLEENLQFIADALGNRGDSSRDVIRNYFLNDFYKDHLKIYQKRPIYWLFDSGKKNGFKALIYMHRYKPNLLATMRTDYVHEQQERYRTQLQHLEASMQHASPADLAKINKQIGKLKEQSLELLAYEEKIHHLADQMIDIDLDDGVKVNYAKFQDVLAPIK